jgi:hypothetical protein
VYTDPLTNEAKDLFASFGHTETLARVKKLLKAEILKPDPIMVIDFNVLNETHFVSYILSLRKSDGAFPTNSTYNTQRAAFNHIFTMYR